MVGQGEEDEESYDGAIVVLCIGNRYMRDDGVGPEVSRRLRGMDLASGVLVRDSVSINLGIIWEFRAASKLVVVDAVGSGDRPGTVTRHLLSPGKGPARLLGGLHGLDLSSAVDLAVPEAAGLTVVVVGVEPRDCGAGEGLTEEVAAAVPRAVDAVLAEMRSGVRGHSSGSLRKSNKGKRGDCVA